MKTCFVISPISDEGTDIRKHADNVFKYIITPAMEHFDIEAYRSDHLHEPGLISSQMWNSILTSDLCVAVLTYDNANVYYELAVAQSIEKPVIILREKGKDLPFDIKDLRCVYYDLDPDALFETKIYSKEIIEHIKFYEENNWKGLKIIPQMSIIEGITSKNYEFFERTLKFGPQDNWEDFLRKTKDKFDLMSKSANTWKDIHNLSKILLNKAQDGCKIRILLMHKENPALKQLCNTEIKEKTFEERCYIINKNFKYYSDIAEQSENIEVRRILNGCSTNIQALSDEYALYIPYFYSQTTSYTPLWKCIKGSFLYNLLEQEFETLWRING